MLCLKIIVNYLVGVDYCDLLVLVEWGIMVINMLDVFFDVIVEFVMLLMFGVVCYVVVGDWIV